MSPGAQGRRIESYRLRHRVALQHENATQDAAGQRVNSWITYRDCFALVTDMGSKETSKDKTEAIDTTAVTIAYPRQGRFPSTQDRVIYRETTNRTRTMNVSSVKVTDDKSHIMLNCLEVLT